MESKVETIYLDRDPYLALFDAKESLKFSITQKQLYSNREIAKLNMALQHVIDVMGEGNKG